VTGPANGPRERPRRDRDAAGRARNARPRDAAGRPLPRGATGDARVPDDLVPTPVEALALAQGYLDSDRPFPAHDVLEAAWKNAPPSERALWQGLAQVAVGLTHVQRGNARGAAALLRRGAARIGPYATAPPHLIDVAGVVAYALALAERVEREGLSGLPAERLRPRLSR
jgi:uncharacterized protein